MDDLTPSDPDMINFFILCRIILKDVPDVLRGIFKKKIAKPLKIEKWEDTENCGKILEKSEKFKLALNDDQKKLLKNGQTEKWDTTLLKEVLLYSSLFPVADFFEEVEVKLIEPKTEVKSTKPKTEVKSTKPKTEVKTELIYVPSQDDSTRFKQDDVILIDNKGRALKVKIKSFEKGKITVDQKLPLKIKDSYDIYKCTEEWVAIKGLSDIRNTHCHDVKDHVEKAKLEEVMDKIKNEYEKLGVEKCRIDQMQELKSEPIGDHNWAALWRKDKESREAMEKRIKELEAENREGVAENRKEVAENRGRIAENREGIAENREGIAENREGIAENREGIRKLAGSSEYMISIQETSTTTTTHVAASISRPAFSLGHTDEKMDCTERDSGFPEVNSSMRNGDDLSQPAQESDPSQEMEFLSILESQSPQGSSLDRQIEIFISRQAAKLKKLQQELETLYEQIDELTRKCKEKDDINVHLFEKCTDLQKELKQVVADKEEVEADLSNTTAQLVEVTSQNEKRLHALEMEVQKLRHEKEKQELEHKAKLAEERQKIAEKSTELAEEKQKVAEKSNELAGEKLRRYEKEKEQVEKEKEQVKKEKEQVEKEKEQVEKERDLALQALKEK